MNATTNDAKRVPTISATIEGDVLQLDFAHGSMLKLDSSKLSSEIYQYAALHGLKQKLVDAAAISRNPETGRAATITDKFNAVQAVYNRLLLGEWNATREGSGATGGLLLQALCRLYTDKTPEQLRDYLAGKTDGEKAALRKNPKVASVIDTIRAETGKAAGIDTDELLDELDGL